MKKLFLSILFLLVTEALFCQTQNDINFYFDQAKANSPLINKSKNDNLILKLNMQQIHSMLSKPEINLESNFLFAPIVSRDNSTNRFEWVSQGATNYSGYDLALSDGGQYQAYVSLKQPVFTGYLYRDFSNKAMIASRINNNKIELSIHETERLVSHQYLLCLKSKKQSEISLSLLNELKEQIQMMEKLVESSFYKQSDLLILQIEYENRKIDYQNYLSEYKNNLSELNLLCGISDTAMVIVQDTEFALNSKPVRVSAFLTSFELDSLNILADLTLYGQKYKPQINIFANTGLNAVYLPGFNRLGFSAGIDLSWNIFDGRQKQMEFEKAKINLNNLQFEKNIVIKSAATNKERYTEQIKLLEHRITITEKQLVKYRDLLGMYEKELSNALISVMDLKNLLKDIALKKQENLLLKMKKQALIISYNYWNY